MERAIERRTAPSVDFVRNWITDLRLRGGDFRKEAAQAASEAAARARRLGYRPDEIFEIARHTYYRTLASIHNTEGEPAGV